MSPTNRRNRSATVGLLLASLLHLAAWSVPAAADAVHRNHLRRRHTDCQLLLTEKRLLGWDVSGPQTKVSRATRVGLAGDGSAALALFEEAALELRRIDTWAGSPQVVRISGAPRSGGDEPGDGDAILETGALRLRFDSTGGITGLDLGRRPLASPVTGGFYGRDMASGAEGRFTGRVETTDSGLRLEGEIAALKTRLEARLQKRDGWIEVEGTVRDTSGTDRALVLCFKIPLNGTGLSWGDDQELTVPIPAGPVIMQNSAPPLLEKSSTRLTSIHPLATVGDERGGVALATAIDHPAVFRINYDGLDGSLNLYYELGLSKQTTRFPGAAQFRFVIYAPEEPAWGFRSALDTYYRIYPDAFVDLVDESGLWGRREGATALGAEYKRMGFSWLQGENNDSKLGKRLGLWSVRYCKPWWYFLPGPVEDTPGRLAGALADPSTFEIHQASYLIFGQVGSRELARMVALSATHGRNGEPVAWPDRKYGGVRYLLNPDLDIEGPDGSRSAGRLTLEESIAPAVRKHYRDKGQKRWCLFFDVAGTALRHLNFRQDQMAFVDYPLTFDEQTNRPAILGQSSAAEHLEGIQSWAHGKGGIVGVNTSPYPYNMVFLAAFGDIAGTEHLPGRREMCNRRVLSRHKPIGFTSVAGWEPLMKAGLFYAVFPTHFELGKRREGIEHLEGAKPLLLHTVPLIRTLDSAGWEPVTRARSGNDRILVERYGRFGEGPVYLTVWNQTADENTVTLQLDEVARSQLGGSPKATDLANNRKVTVTSGSLKLTLGADEVAMIKVLP